MGRPEDREALHLEESVRSLGGEAWLCWRGRTWWGRRNLILELWNCLTASPQHLLAAVSSTFMIWIERAWARCRVFTSHQHWVTVPAVSGQVTVFPVHVGATSEVVGQPDAKVLHLQQGFLEHLPTVDNFP